MFVVVLTSILAELLSVLDSKKILKNGLLYGFILVTIIAAIRYDYGNDYRNYMRIFATANKYPIDQLEQLDSTFKDVGAVVIYRIFYPLGFFSFVGFASGFNGWVFYKFITQNLRRNEYWLGFFIYLFQFDIYCLPMSMIRQGIAIALCVLAFQFLVKKQNWKSILILLIAISIHKSSVIFAPVLLLKMIPVKSGKTIVLLLLLMCVLCFSSSFIIAYLFENVLNIPALQFYFGQYGNAVATELRFIRKFVIFFPFIFALIYLWHSEFKSKSALLVVVSTIGVLTLPFSEIIPLMSRLAYYFNVFVICGFPISLRIIRNKIIKYGVISIFLVFLSSLYYSVFTESVYTVAFENYNTIFSLLNPY